MNSRTGLLALALVFAPNLVWGDTATRLLRLLEVPGVAGYEHSVRQAIELALPMEARVRADNMGNIVLRTGRGESMTLVVAPLDESGFVVSAVTDDGYLRVHRHTAAPGPRLATQFVIGQPIEIRTATGAIIPGVTATPSVHLRSFRDPADDARVQNLDDVWIDVGAESAGEVERLGVRMLDSVTLRERGIGLAGGRVSGIGAGGRAAALALAEMVRRRAPGPMPPGAASIAWVVQSEYGHRGLLRLLETLKPNRLILLRAPGAPGEDPNGAIGRIGDGPIVAADDDAVAAAAKSGSVRVQSVPATRLRTALPAEYASLPVHVVALPVLFAQTPVETVDARDVDALAQLVASLLGFGQLAAADGAIGPGGADAVQKHLDATYQTLRALIETSGVSGHEGPVRDEILKRMPTWAKPEVDERGNVRVTFGNEDGPPLVFLAHMDEVGFEIASIGDDGRARLRARGGMYLSVYEAHPVLVHTAQGPVGAVLAPRLAYATATTPQPQLDQLTLYFGTTNAAESRALGVAEGHPVTVRKRFVPLAGSRATGRAMDDRNGSTALLLALQKIDPSTITNHVRFAWTVEEETGLGGAGFMAERSRPDAVFAIDTFVSSDTPVDTERLAGAKLGKGAVLRGLDSRTLVQPQIIDRIVALAKTRKIPLQIGVTSGGTDASVYNAAGALDIGLSWPGRYSHSPVEVMDRRDLEALVELILTLASEY